MSGQIVDASLIAAPRQRKADDEKKAIKEGRIPPNWKAKLRHKDRVQAIQTALKGRTKRVITREGAVI